MSATARVVAQAKVNLYLRVLAREASGFHSIETIFQRLDVGDEVTVRITPHGRSLDCAGSAMPAGGLGPTERNLAYRAAALYAEGTGWPNGFAIEVDKRIPVGGGLGGGSADAGAVLRALDAVSPNPLGPRLVEMAALLGSDVPFMAIESPTALGWSRGERLHPLPPLEPRDVLLAIPDFGIATPDAYAWLAAERGGYAPIGCVLDPAELGSWSGIANLAVNDFERVVAARHPEIAELVDDFTSQGALISMMSGSGSSVFGVFPSRPDVAAVVRNSAAKIIQTNTSARVGRVALDQ